MQWVLAGRLVDGTGSPVRHDLALGIQDQRICCVQPLPSWQPGRADGVIDHRDATVIPGLIDSHVHLVFDHASDSATIRQRVQCSDPTALALLAARNAAMCLSAGVTTVRDCGGRDLVTLQVRDAIRRGWLTGPRILAAGPPITRRGGHLAWCGAVADTPEQLRTTIRSLCASGVDFLKLVGSGGNMTPGSQPFQPTYSEAELRAAVETAHEHGRRVAVHALNAEAIRRASAAGVDTIEHCLWNGPDGQPAFDAAAARELVARGTYVGINMAGIDRILLPAETDDPTTIAAHRAKLRDRWAGAREMLVPAEALGIADDVGTLEVDKRAELVVVDGDPSSNIAALRRVREVWRDGRVVAHEHGLAAPAEVAAVVPEADRA